jgi:hypothetical protein
MMAKLTTKERNKLPKKDFAGPDRNYPVENKAHARNAKARASQMEARGKLSPSAKEKIDTKADKILDEGKKRKKKDAVKVERSRSTM